MLGDGAEWIWHLAAMHFPGATCIVDCYHACEHIHNLAKVLYGEGNPQGQRWAKEHCDTLVLKGPGTLIGALKRRKAKNAAQREAVRRELGYFVANRERMDYPAYRARGMMIGSGPVEAACKVVVGQRMNGSGMHWSLEGADSMLAIRTAVLNGDFDEIGRLSHAA